MTDNSGPGYRSHPDHRVDVAPFAGLVVVEAGGRPLANSSRALRLQESKYPDVYYIPREDVRMAELAPREGQTYCPFKGHASYFGLAGRKEGQAIAWCYEAPYDEVARIAGHIAFYRDRVDVFRALPDSHQHMPRP